MVQPPQRGWDEPLTRLARNSRKLESLADPPEDVAFGDSATIAGIDRSPKRRKPRITIAFVELQTLRSGAQHTSLPRVFRLNHWFPFGGW
jgi:hypothetical protein